MIYKGDLMEKTKWYEEKYFEKLKRLDPITGKWYIPYENIFHFVEEIIISTDAWLATGKRTTFKPINCELNQVTYRLFTSIIASVGRGAESVTDAICEWFTDTVYLMRQVLYIGETLYRFAIMHMDDCVQLIVKLVYMTLTDSDSPISKENLPTLARLLQENGLISEEMAKYLSEGFRLLVEKRDDGKVCYVYWKFD